MDRAEAEAAYRPAALEALKAFGVEPAGLTFVNLSENITFKVIDARDRSALVLRLHRPGYHDAEALKSEPLWTRALAAAGVPVPTSIPAIDGEDYVPVDVAATGERRFAGLARWIDGEVLGDSRGGADEVGEVHFERLGALTATMHNQSSAWTPPPRFRRHALDAEGLMGEAPFWGPFWDHPVFSADERAQLLVVRDRLHIALLRLGKDPATYGVIHADLHPGNLLVDGDRLAVIDFDDTAFGWHAYDLAVALVYYQDQTGFEAFRDACLRGYRRIRPLSDAVVGLLPMFTLIRGLVQIGWMHQRPELPTEPWLAERKTSILERAARLEPPC